MSGADSAHDGIALWQQLQATALVLLAVRHGTSTTSALERVAPSLRPGVQALAFQVLRSLGRAQALRQRLASRPPPSEADALLCTALALSWNEQTAPYEPFTLVNQTVEAAKRAPGTKAQANFINACLRRFLREKSALLAATDNDPLARWNHPGWWVARLKRDHPNQWESILDANNAHAPMTLRVNLKKSGRDAYLSQLKAANIDAIPSGNCGITLANALPVQAIVGFADGVVSVQDAAAQLAAPLLIDGMNSGLPLRVLDACAAPGGKTAHLLELAQCDVLALDIDSQRCERIRQTLQRLGLGAQVLAADAAEPSSWWDGRLFDAILLDAPCTASGIVRRHPDVPWLRRESDIDRLATIQARLLKALWPLLKPGGRMLYCTCSVFKAEGIDQVQTFLVHNTDASLLPSPGQLVPYFRANMGGVPDNSDDDHDGFYLALLEKHAA